MASPSVRSQFRNSKYFAYSFAPRELQKNTYPWATPEMGWPGPLLNLSKEPRERITMSGDAFRPAMATCNIRQAPSGLPDIFSLANVFEIFDGQ